jgi:periplasmic protein TonB
MRYFQLVLLCFICVAKSYGQTDARSYHTVVVEITKEKKPKRISTKVEIKSPTFPGGDSSLAQALEDDLNRTISIKNKAKAGKYIVSVKFLLERDGSVSDIHCINDPGFGMCEKVIGVMKRKLRWNWRPSVDTKVREYHKTYTTPQASN